MAMQYLETARLEVRMPVDIYAMLKRSAALQGRTLSDFVISVTSDAASKAIEKAEILRLSVKDQQKVAEMLLNPPPPSPALMRAAERYHQNADNS